MHNCPLPNQLVPSPYDDPFPDLLSTALTSSTRLQFLNDLCINPPIDHAQRSDLRDDSSLPDFLGVRLTISVDHQMPNEARHHITTSHGGAALLEQGPANGSTAEGPFDAVTPSPSHIAAASLLTSDPGAQSVFTVMQCVK